jgi:hypothetical protein
MAIRPDTTKLLQDELHIRPPILLPFSGGGCSYVTDDYTDDDDDDDDFNQNPFQNELKICSLRFLLTFQKQRVHRKLKGDGRLEDRETLRERSRVKEPLVLSRVKLYSWTGVELLRDKD